MKKIKLTQGKVALVDDEDFEQLSKYKWYAYKHRYTWYSNRAVYDTSRGPEQSDRIRVIRMHRQIMGCTENDGQQVDHIDGNGLNNQRSNLRFAGFNGNQRNSRARNGRKYKGVYLYHGKKKLKRPWNAKLRKGNRDISFGWFTTEYEAVLAYNEGAKKYFGEFARINKLTELFD